jgi:hypothetical protein
MCCLYWRCCGGISVAVVGVLQRSGVRAGRANVYPYVPRWWYRVVKSAPAAAAASWANRYHCRCCFVRDDVATFLRAALEAGQGWDIVILDPPKLAPNRWAPCCLRHVQDYILQYSLLQPGNGCCNLAMFVCTLV